MDDFIFKKWRHYSGVDVLAENPMSVSNNVKMEASIFAILCFIPKSVILAKLSGQWHCVELPPNYNRAQTQFFNLDLDDDGIYYMEATHAPTRFNFRPIDMSDFEDNLNPIPYERRMKRDSVMASYSKKLTYKLPRHLN